MNAPVGEETLFAEALRRPPDQRAAFLAESTREHPDLRQRVAALLASYESGEFLEQAAGSPCRPTHLSPLTPTEQLGDRIGHYKLLQQIGEGGCGVVYMAEQVEPVRRRVALKVIKLGMDTRSVIARFEAERQALAMMDHPSIAKVLDAGATESGRPYFVMELVRGMKITEFCDEKRLSTRQRLDLFMQVCQAIQHAHQKGIIHRDIKPSNILVTVNDGVAVPKVIDFGIAKATSGQVLTDKTVFTAFEQFIGTPAYMSPEQAMLTSLDIDTRSDIYALGVLLYELLTGRTPFDSKDLLAAGLDAMRRTLRERDPQRPSTRVSTLPGDELSTTAQRRSLEAPQLVSELRGDLDWIVMKALEKDRARRYETANGLAADIRRHLNNEPVVACPPSAAYRLRKLVRRNRLVFGAGMSVAMALVVGLGVAIWMFTKERAAVREQSRLRQQAQAEAAKSEQVVQFLRETLKGMGPSAAWGGNRTLIQEMLRQTAERIDRGLTNQPDISVTLRLSLAETYEELGLYEAETEIADQTLAFARSTFGERSLPAANALTQLGWAEWRLNRLDVGEGHLSDGLDLRRRLLGNEHALVADSLEKLSYVRANQGKHDESVEAAREALSLRRKLLGSAHPEVARSLAALASALRIAKHPGEAEPYAREAVTMHRALLGAGHYQTTTTLNKLAMVLADQGQQGEAENLMREVLATQRKLLGEEHPELQLPLNWLGNLLFDQGRWAEAEPVLREVLALQRKLLGDEDPVVVHSLNRLAIALRQEGKLSEAEATHRETLRLRRNLFGDEHPDVAQSLNNLAVVLTYQGKLTEAETMHREALTLRRRLLGDEHPEVAESLNALAAVLTEEGKLDEAETLLGGALALRRKQPVAEHPDVAESLHDLGMGLARQGRLAEAESRFRDGLKLLPEPSEDHASLETPILGVLLHHLADVLCERKNLSEARSLAEQAAALYRRHPGWNWVEAAHASTVLRTVLRSQRDFGQLDMVLPQHAQFLRAQLPSDDPRLAGSLAVLIHELLGREQFVEAEPLARACLAIREKQAPDDWRTFNNRSQLGGSLLGQQRYAEAEPLLLSGYDGMMQREAKIPPPGRSRLTETLQRLVQLNEATGRSDAAAGWRQRLTDYQTLLSLPVQADARARQGRFSEAVDDLVRFREAHPDDHLIRHQLAALLVGTGKFEEYRENCRDSLQRFAWTDDPMVAERVAKGCLILPASGVDLDVVGKLADQAVAATNHSATGWFQLVKGLAEYRQGRFASAIEWMKRVLAASGEPAARQVEAYMVLAMAHHQLSQRDEAHAAFGQGTEIERTRLPQRESGDLGEGWLEWIVAHALLDEARALLKGVPGSRAEAR